MLVANFGGGTVSVVDLDRKEEIQEIGVGVEPYGVLYSEDPDCFWVSVSGESRVKKYRISTGELVEQISTAPLPRGLSLDTNSGRSRLLVTPLPLCTFQAHRWPPQRAFRRCTAPSN